MRAPLPAGVLLLVLGLAGCASDQGPGAGASGTGGSPSQDPAVVASIESALDDADATSGDAEDELEEPLPSP